jgi:hypothetical protein
VDTLAGCAVNQGGVGADIVPNPTILPFEFSAAMDFVPSCKISAEFCVMPKSEKDSALSLLLDSREV